MPQDKGKNKYLEDKIEILLQQKKVEDFSDSDVKAIRKVPKYLYKYRNFDEYTFDMIERQYVYLPNPQSLDDQFECAYNELNSSLQQMTDGQLHKILDCAIIKKMIELSPKKNQYLLKKVEKSCSSNDTFSREKYIRFIMNKTKKSSNEIETTILKADAMVKEILENEEFKNIIDTLLHLLSDLRVKQECVLYQNERIVRLCGQCTLKTIKGIV